MSAENDDDIPSYLVKKSTIMKDRVGCVKTSTYDLPAETFTYGMKATDSSAEKAGDIISNWVTANPSAQKQSQKMVVAQNILAIKKGAITAKAMRQYGIDHPNVRMKEVLVQDSSRPDVIKPSHEGPFGRRTVYAEESFGEIIQAKYTNFASEDADYPTITTIKKTGFMPEPKPTKASLAVSIAREGREEAQKATTKKFCMKKFQNIPGRGGYGQESQTLSNQEY